MLNSAYMLLVMFCVNPGWIFDNSVSFSIRLRLRLWESHDRSIIFACFINFYFNFEVRLDFGLDIVNCFPVSAV